MATEGEAVSTPGNCLGGGMMYEKVRVGSVGSGLHPYVFPNGYRTMQPEEFTAALKVAGADVVVDESAWEDELPALSGVAHLAAQLTASQLEVAGLQGDVSALETIDLARRSELADSRAEVTSLQEALDIAGAGNAGAFDSGVIADPIAALEDK